MTDFDDDRLMAQLRAIELAQPVSERSLELARAAFDWRTLDAELAELVADSALAPPGAVRAVGQPRLVTFEGSNLAIELEIEPRGEGRLITGRLLPPQPAAMELVRPDGERRAVEVDAHGRFSAELAGGGPVAFRVLSLRTDWLVT